MRRTTEYTWTDHKPNTEIAKELNITRFEQNIGLREKMDTNYKSNAKLQITQTDKTYIPKGKRNQSIPLKILLDV
jgi:hypothetical protein